MDKRLLFYRTLLFLFFFLLFFSFYLVWLVSLWNGVNLKNQFLGMIQELARLPTVLQFLSLFRIVVFKIGKIVDSQSVQYHPLGCRKKIFFTPLINKTRQNKTIFKSFLFHPYLILCNFYFCTWFINPKH